MPTNFHTIRRIEQKSVIRHLQKHVNETFAGGYSYSISFNKPSPLCHQSSSVNVAEFFVTCNN